MPQLRENGRFVSKKKRKRGKNGQFCKEEDKTDHRTDDTQMQDVNKPDDEQNEATSIFPVDDSRIIDVKYFIQQLEMGCKGCRTALVLSMRSIISEVKKGVYIWYHIHLQ